MCCLLSFYYRQKNENKLSKTNCPGTIHTSLTMYKIHWFYRNCCYCFVHQVYDKAQRTHTCFWSIHVQTVLQPIQEIQFKNWLKEDRHLFHKTPNFEPPKTGTHPSIGQQQMMQKSSIRLTLTSTLLSTRKITLLVEERCSVSLACFLQSTK